MPKRGWRALAAGARAGPPLTSPELPRPAQVLAQDLPFRLWYEGLLAVWPGRTYLPLHASLANLTEAVHWARAHPAEARAMVRRANAAIGLATSVGGMRLYMQELLKQYTATLGFTPRAEPRAVLFQCRPTRDCRECTTPGVGPAAERRSSVCGVKCGFRLKARRQGEGPGEQIFDTLHDAGQAHSYRARISAPKTSFATSTEGIEVRYARS